MSIIKTDNFISKFENDKHFDGHIKIIKIMSDVLATSIVF